MANIGSWASIISGVVVLAVSGLVRRRHHMSPEHSRLWNAIMLIAVGLIIGHPPWLTDRASDTLRIGASAIGILASLVALLLIRPLLASARRHDA